MIELPGAGLGPRIARRTDLNFMGDWGQANFHRILSWLCQEINDRTGVGSTVSIRNGKGGTDAVAAIMAREMDLAISTPSHFARMAMQGLGPFNGRPHTELCALAVLPQDDRLIFAIDRKHQVERISQIAERRLPLRIAVSSQDGINFIGLGARGMLEASNLGADQLKGWGGSFIEYERPEQCLAGMERGEADAIVQEAIMTPWWLDVLKARDLAVLPWELSALETVERKFGWQRAKLRAGYYPGQNLEIDVLDFADFQLMVHAQMPEDLAYLITWCLCNTSRVIERQFAAFPRDRTPLGYPLEPAKMALTVLPLHPGARRYYEEAGIALPPAH